ncbi:MAG: hypothetical protein JWO43_19 [Candidatus Adlerbacteria bacterium]|nr:hypothetical protein [Candidatus Adlerbacteria bacterium]
MPFEGPTGERLRKALFVAVIALGVFLTIQALAGLMNLRYIGAGISAANTISVSGHGESFSTPDIATFNFSVVSEKSTVAAAQADATAKINAVTAYLKSAGVDEKDIQTSDYAINPQYDYTNQVCTNGYCPGGKQVLRGYEVRQSTTVKVRDTAKAGDLLAGVGTKGATEVSGLNFTFDNPNQGQDEARDKAIADAKAKAEVLAKQLGVTLVRVVSFNENSGGPVYPMAYKSAGTANLDAVAQSAPAISVGQNKTTDDVSVTYEIR